MQLMTSVLKTVDPQEVVGQIITNPKVQLAVGAVMTGGGGAVASKAAEVPDFSVPMAYMGFAAMALGLVLTGLCIAHRGILVYKDLKDIK